MTHGLNIGVGEVGPVHCFGLRQNVQKIKGTQYDAAVSALLHYFHDDVDVSADLV